MIEIIQDLLCCAHVISLRKMSSKKLSLFHFSELPFKDHWIFCSMHTSHFLYSYIYPYTSIYETVSLSWLSKILLQLMWVCKCLFQTLQFSCAWICVNFAESFHPFLQSGYIVLALYQECPKIQFFNSLLTFVSLLLSIPWFPLDFLPLSLSPFLVSLSLLCRLRWKTS